MASGSGSGSGSGAGGSGAPDWRQIVRDELRAVMSRKINRALQGAMQQQRQPAVPRLSIVELKYFGTASLHTIGCTRTALLQSRGLGATYSADVLG